MQLRAEQLDAHLSKTLAPVYAVHGDEPLLALEAVDAIRAAARRKGFAEREVFEPTRYFDWSEFRHSAESQSLFGGRKIVELRLASGKIAAPVAKVLVDYCARPNPDVLLLLSMPRPEGAWWKSDWFAALDGAGTVVEVQPVARARLPAWLGQRIARQKQSAGPEVLEYLVERVEGNLLAAHQEIQKLGLLAPAGELTLESVQEAVASVARYDVNGAVEALLARDVARYVRIIEGLRDEGEQPSFVLFVMSSALFVLQGLQRGGQLDALCLQHRMFNKPLKAVVEGAARRFTAPQLDEALAHASLIDRTIKGVRAGDAWEEFIRLGLKLAHGSKG